MIRHNKNNKKDKNYLQELLKNNQALTRAISVKDMKLPMKTHKNILPMQKRRIQNPILKEKWKLYGRKNIKAKKTRVKIRWIYKRITVNKMSKTKKKGMFRKV